MMGIFFNFSLPLIRFTKEYPSNFGISTSLTISCTLLKSDPGSELLRSCHAASALVYSMISSCIPLNNSQIALLAVGESSTTNIKGLFELFCELLLFAGAALAIPVF